MAAETLGRGSTPTPWRDAWGLRDARLRPLVVALVVAAILHLPAVPGQFSAWIRVLFGSDEAPSGPQQEEVVAVELDVGLLDDEAVEQPEEPGGASGGQEPPPASEPEPAEAEVTPEMFDDDEGEKAVPDAGVPDAPDAGAAEEEVADAGPDAGPEVAENVPPAGPIQDPYEAAGGPGGGVGPEHPNVRIYIAADVLRQRKELATMFGELLNSVPQWTDLLGGTELNPIRDFDHLLISGPQMRDPRWIHVFLDYNVGSPRMRSAIDRVVTKSDGKWLEGFEMPVAAIAGDRRVVLLDPQRMLAVVPASAEDQIPKLSTTKPFRKSGNAGIVIYVITPHRASIGGAFAMPKSVKWMRVRFSLAGAEDFQVEIEAEDESAEAAREHAAALERQIEALRPVPGISLFVDKYFIGKPTWEVDGARFRARAPVSREQVRRIMRLIKEVVLPPLIARHNAKKKPDAPAPKRPRPRPAPAPAAPPASSPAPAPLAP